MLPPIVDAIKKHDNNSSALQFLKITYMKLNVLSPFERLSREC
jgi:hypothetical protein